MTSAVAAAPPIPPEADLLRSFVDTLQVSEGTDVLDSPAALERWLRGRRLIARGVAASGRDLALALRLRKALRAVLGGGRDGPDKAAEAAFEDVCRELPLVVVCSGDSLAPATGGVRGALAKIVAAAAVARIRGSWPRLKLCAEETCQAAFYDTSRNRSKRWCGREEGGDRARTRPSRPRR